MQAHVQPSAHYVLYPPAPLERSPAPRHAPASAAATLASQAACRAAAHSQPCPLSSQHQQHQPPPLSLPRAAPHRRRTHRRQQALCATLGSSAAPPLAHEPLQGMHTEHMMGEAGFLPVHAAEAAVAGAERSAPQQWQQLDDSTSSGESSNGKHSGQPLKHDSTRSQPDHAITHQHHLRPGDDGAAPARVLLSTHTLQALQHAAPSNATKHDSSKWPAAPQDTPRKPAEQQQQQPETGPQPSLPHQPPLQAEGAHAAPLRLRPKPGPVIGGRWGKWVLHMRPWYAHVRPWWSRRAKRRRKPKPNRFRMTVSRTSELDVLQEFLRWGQLHSQAPQQQQQLPVSAPASATQQPQQMHHAPREGRASTTPVYTTLLMQPRFSISKPSRSAIHTLGGAPANRRQPFAHYTLDGGAHWATAPFCNMRTAQGRTLLAATLDCSSSSSSSSGASTSGSAPAEADGQGMLQVVVSTHPLPPQPPETGTHSWRHHVLQLQPGACYMLEQEAATTRRTKSCGAALLPLSITADPLMLAAHTPPSVTHPAASLTLPPPSPLHPPLPAGQPHSASPSTHPHPSPSRPLQHHHQLPQHQGSPELWAQTTSPPSQQQEHHHHHHHQQQQQRAHKQQPQLQRHLQQQQAHEQQHAHEQHPQQQQQQQQRPLFHRLLRQPTVLVASLHMVAGRRRRPEDDACTRRFQAAWRHSSKVHPSLLVYTSHRSWRSYLQLWQDKQHVLDSPDVLILANGTRIMYQVAGGGWQEDSQWRALLSQGWERARVVQAVETVAAAMNEAAQQQYQEQQEAHLKNSSPFLPLQGLPAAASGGEQDAAGVGEDASKTASRGSTSVRGPGSHAPQVLVRADVVKEQNAHRVRILVRAHAARALMRALQTELEGARAQQQHELQQQLHQTPMRSSAACTWLLPHTGHTLRFPSSSSSSSNGTHSTQPLPNSQCSLPSSLVFQRHALASGRQHRPAPPTTPTTTSTSPSGSSTMGSRPGVRAEPAPTRASLPPTASKQQRTAPWASPQAAAPQPLAWSLLLQPQHVLGHGRGWVAVDVVPEGAGVGPAVSHVLSRFGITAPAGRQGVHQHHHHQHHQMQGEHVQGPATGLPVVACTNTEHDARSLQQVATHSIVHAPVAKQAGGGGNGGQQQQPVVASHAWGADSILEGLAKLGLC